MYIHKLNYKRSQRNFLLLLIIFTRDDSRNVLDLNKAVSNSRRNGYYNYDKQTQMFPPRKLFIVKFIEKQNRKYHTQQRKKRPSQ